MWMVYGMFFLFNALWISSRFEGDTKISTDLPGTVAGLQKSICTEMSRSTIFIRALKEIYLNPENRGSRA